MQYLCYKDKAPPPHQASSVPHSSVEPDFLNYFVKVFQFNEEEEWDNFDITKSQEVQQEKANINMCQKELISWNKTKIVP